MTKTAFIGGGTMGEAIIAPLLRGGASAGDISVSDVSAPRRNYLAATYKIAVHPDAPSAASNADIVLLAVKPQDFAGAGKELAPVLRDGQTVVSIMAGVRLPQLGEVLGHPALVRAMPNTPAQIGAGFVAWTATAAVAPKAREAVAAILATLGVAVEVPDEKYVDMATAVSASGPGFVYLVIEAMIDGGVQIGLNRELATQMVCETVLGSAKFMQATGEHPAVLRNRVTSPGGTTAAGLAEMEALGVRAGLAAGIVAAYQRAIELGG